ncbi:proline dehydrogenase family protein [Gemmatimonas sp.]
MLRTSLLYLSRQQRVFDFVKNVGFARKMASRFVAGETISSACDAVAQLNAKGISATLDLLGESVFNEAEARATGRQYLDLLDRIQERKLNANVSVKLTALGQDVSDDLGVEVVREVIARAKQYNSFVRLDMESSAYTDRTLDTFEQKLFPGNEDNVGVVLQSCLRRTLDDVARANRLSARVRICKGAYLEPPAVAFPDKADVDKNYVACLHKLLTEGRYPGIATHDEVIIAEAKRFAREQGIGADKFEFQMLYGVRRDLQEQIVKEGYRVRVYVPFGSQWYPYLMRRLAERPANIAFMAGNIMKESLGG